MNDVSSPAPGASLLPDSTSLITSVHFILIALFAVAVVAMIVIGIARKRRRKEADADLAERVEEHESATEPPAPVEAMPVSRVEDPIAPAAPREASPVAEMPAAGTPAPLFALTQLKGLGPKVAAQLEATGIGSVDQLAALSDADAERVDGSLGPFAGRLSRDRWVEQARLLAAGDRAGFEAKFGKL